MVNTLTSIKSIIKSILNYPTLLIILIAVVVVLGTFTGGLSKFYFEHRGECPEKFVGSFFWPNQPKFDKKGKKGKVKKGYCGIEKKSEQ